MNAVAKKLPQCQCQDNTMSTTSGEKTYRLMSIHKEDYIIDTFPFIHISLQENVFSA